MNTGAQLASESGGELILGRKESPFATTRFDMQVSWAESPSGFARWCAALAQQLPSDHPPLVLQGWCHASLERADVVIKAGQTSLIPYTWTAGNSSPVTVETDW